MCPYLVPIGHYFHLAIRGKPNSTYMDFGNTYPGQKPNAHNSLEAQ